MVNPATKAVSNGREQRRQRVLDEAAKTLNRRGVSQTSLAEIAGGLGVSRAALYYYFEDQEDLVFQCYRHTFEQMTRRLREACRLQSASLDRIVAFVDVMLSETDSELASPCEAYFLREDQRAVVLGLYDGLRASLAEIIQQGIDAGEIRPCRPRLVASALVGLIHWSPATARWRTTLPLSRHDITNTMTSLIRHGVAARRSDPSRYQPLVLSPPGVPVGSIFDPDAMAQARREALLMAASWLFNLKGVDATSLEEIALRVGVTKKVIYHNMGDKQTLVAQCHHRSFEFFEQVADRLTQFGGAGVDALCAGSHALAEASLREDIATFVPLTGHETWPEGAREELQQSAERTMAKFLNLYERGWADGSVRDINARAIGTMLPGLFEWLPKWLDALTAAEREVAPRELAELYRVGLSPLRGPMAGAY